MSQSQPKSVTQWIEAIKQGDDEAAAQLWERYFQKMVQAARRKMGDRALVIADAEDVALSAFDSLCRGAAKGHFDQLTNRHNLWALLLTITTQKSVDQIRRELRQIRGSGNVVRECDLPAMDEESAINRILSQEPSAEFLALMEEQYSLLLSQLRDDRLRNIVNWKIEGYSNDQIAKRLGVSVHTVGRKLRLIRLAWSRELNRA